MNKLMLHILIVGAFIVALSGCSQPTAIDVGLGQPFTLELGQQASVAGEFQVRFVSVLNDSRCPEDVECVWEGNAEVRLEYFAPNGQWIPFILNTNPGYVTERVILGYKVTLNNLAPYPSHSQPHDYSEYTVELVVARN